MSDAPSDATGGASRPRRAVRVKLAALGIVVLGVVADLGTKAWAAQALGLHPESDRSAHFHDVIPGFFALSGNWNTGITFGLAQGWAWTQPILLFTVAACVALAVWIWRTVSPSRVLHVALALILAGALGNLYDRWTWQKVRDFILFYWKTPDVQFPTFNVADSMIVVGVALILWHELFGRRPTSRVAPA